MTKTTAAEKVRKLRALSAGAGTEKEASAAAAAAFRLKARHGLSEGDLFLLPPIAQAELSQRPTRRAVKRTTKASKLTAAERKLLLQIAEIGIRELEEAWGIPDLIRTMRPILESCLEARRAY